MDMPAWVCMFTNPGTATFPVQSTTSIPEAGACSPIRSLPDGAIALIMPSSTSMSDTFPSTFIFFNNIVPILYLYVKVSKVIHFI